MKPKTKKEKRKENNFFLVVGFQGFLFSLSYLSVYFSCIVHVSPVAFVSSFWRRWFMNIWSLSFRFCFYLLFLAYFFKPSSVITSLSSFVNFYFANLFRCLCFIWMYSFPQPFSFKSIFLSLKTKLVIFEYQARDIPSDPKLSSIAVYGYSLSDARLLYAYTNLNSTQAPRGIHTYVLSLEIFWENHRLTVQFQ